MVIETWKYKDRLIRTWNGDKFIWQALKLIGCTASGGVSLKKAYWQKTGVGGQMLVAFFRYEYAGIYARAFPPTSNEV